MPRKWPVTLQCATPPLPKRKTDEFFGRVGHALWLRQLLPGNSQAAFVLTTRLTKGSASLELAPGHYEAELFEAWPPALGSWRANGETTGKRRRFVVQEDGVLRPATLQFVGR